MEKMGQALSILLLGDEACVGYTLDGSAQTVAVAGLDGAPGCVATVVCDGQDVGIRPEGGTSLAVAGGTLPCAGGLSVDRTHTTLVGIGHEELERPLSLYVHALTASMARFERRTFQPQDSFEVGRDPSCAAHYDNPTVSLHHIRCSLAEDGWVVCDLGSANGTYLNGKRLRPLCNHKLAPGDVIRVLDLVLAMGGPYVCANAPEELCWHGMREDARGRREVRRGQMPHKDVPAKREGWPQFYPAPCPSTVLRRPQMAVDAPPAREEARSQPLIVQTGPTFFMGLCALSQGLDAYLRISQGASLREAFPTLVTALSLLGGSVLWPLVMHRWERRARREREDLRSSRYLAYLDGVETELMRVATEQGELLRTSHVSVRVLMERAHSLSPQLMGHVARGEGFLDVRIGIGSRPLEAQILWPERRFSLEADELWERLEDLKSAVPCLDGVPLAHSLAEVPITGVVGEPEPVWEFVRGIVVQACACYSYQDVKLMLVADEGERGEWEPLLTVAHLYDDRRRDRFLSLTRQGTARLERILEEGLRAAADGRGADASQPYFLVLCTHPRLWAASRFPELFSRLAAAGVASFVVLARGVHDLPRECGTVIDLTDGAGRPDVLEDGVPYGAGGPFPSGPAVSRAEADGWHACAYALADVAGTWRPFEPDIFVSREHMRRFALDLSRLHLKERTGDGRCPSELSFLELYEVGDTVGLDVCRRWDAHDGSRSLSVRIGCDRQGLPAYVDLHERSQGPHALIAGTTGSGKSEFIVTLVLSLCVNYAPDEVTFVLIDYKGGGLAGSFDNSHVRLPHLAGTITNLDGEQIWRALASLRSELVRRQEVLRTASERTGEASMDIHRYLALYRQGVLGEPLPHLVVVADEFAELKQQQPEFMEELITAARIGRSLGVHLVLATQKPAGVVNDQIWSNARLKVSLKVADVTDSKEMLGREDAAHLVRPGEFLLLVGYDEQFMGGQSAYAGTRYRPRAQYVPRDEVVLELLDAEGQVSVSLMPRPASRTSKMSELDAVLAEVVRASGARGLAAAPLWLEPLPTVLCLSEFCAASGHPDVVLGARDEVAGPAPDDALMCVMGLADDPARQRQLRVDVDLARVGCMALYGALGSEVERCLRAMLVSLLHVHTARDLWVYALDPGEGLLDSLSGFPQVGGVVRELDAEGLEALAHTLGKELAYRRGRGRQCREKPAIILAIAHAAAIWEEAPDFEDWLLTYMRDGPRHRMFTLLCAECPGALPYRLRSVLGMGIPFWLNDDDEVREVVGDLGGLVLPHRPCRGVVGVGGRPLVFQGCVLARDRDAEHDCIAALKDGIAPAGCRARRLPRLPATVLPRDLQMPADGRGFPIGLSKRGAETVLSLRQAGGRLLVLGNDRSAMESYLRAAVEVLGGDARVVSGPEEAAELVRRIGQGDESARVAILPEVAVLLDALDLEARMALERLLANADDTSVSLVLTSQYWYVSTRYDDWLRVACMSGDGLWIGDGFADQTLLRYPRLLPSYRETTAAADGFFVSHGNVEAVRVLQDEAQGGQEGELPYG